MPEKAPTLSFQCPKLWQEMPGSEKSRFCQACGHQVQNLSLMKSSEREALFKRAKTERVCGIYFQDLEGNLVTAGSEAELSGKMRALRLATLAGTSLAIAACSKSNESDHEHHHHNHQHHEPASSQEDIPLPGVICPPPEEKNSAIYRTGPGKAPAPDSLLGTLMDGR